MIKTEYTNAQASAASAAPRGTDLPPEYFNEKNGVKYCGGLDNYIEILRMTSKDGQKQKQKIQECFDKKDWKNYTIYVHALKSGMMNIGVQGLSGMAKELEAAGKQNDEAFIASRHAAMMEVFEQTLAMMQASRTIYPAAPQGSRSAGQEAYPAAPSGSRPAGQEAYPAAPQDSRSAGQEAYPDEPQGSSSAGREALDEAQLDRLALEFENAAFAFDEDGMTEIAQKLAGCSYEGQPLGEAMETVMHKIKMSDYMSASEIIARLKDRD